jgi:hypothetical protein
MYTLKIKCATKGRMTGSGNALDIRINNPHVAHYLQLSADQGNASASFCGVIRGHDPEFLGHCMIGRSWQFCNREMGSR